MKRSTARWTTAVAAAALLAVPSSGFAQSAPPQTPPAASAQATQPSTPQEHLRKAEEALAAIPATAITGQDKTKINELKQHVNKLQTMSASGKPAAGWDKEVASIEKTLTQLIGPASGAAATGTAGTAGKAAGSATLSAEARSQLDIVRTQVTAFAAAAGKGDDPAPEAAASTAAEPPMQTTMTSAPPATAASGTAGAVGTTGTQPPAQATEQPQQTEPQNVDPDAAKKHLTLARNSLSEMTQLPAAAQLTGDARTQVTQLISNFNELITTNAQWRDSYAKVQGNLTALIGAETTDESAARATAAGTAGAVGTSGTAGAIDPAIRAKLVEFRSHLDKFEQAAGGAKTEATPDPAAAAAAANPPATAATANPPTTSAERPPVTTAEQPAAATPQSGQGDRQEVLRHVQAIEALLQLSGSATPTGTSGTATATTQSGVTLTPEQVSQLKTHLSELKRLLEQK